MKKLIVLILFFGINFSTTAQHADLYGKYGIGAQATFPVFGLSFIMNTNSPISVQAILGLFGGLKLYSGRLLYRMPGPENLSPYAYGLIGAWSYHSSTNDGSKKTKIVPAYGGGLGLEYFRSENLALNLEIGYGALKFKRYRKLSGILYGGGIHFYFG